MGNFDKYFEFLHTKLFTLLIDEYLSLLFAVGADLSSAAFVAGLSR